MLLNTGKDSIMARQSIKLGQFHIGYEDKKFDEIKLTVEGKGELIVTVDDDGSVIVDQSGLNVSDSSGSNVVGIRDRTLDKEVRIASFSPPETIRHYSNDADLQSAYEHFHERCVKVGLLLSGKPAGTAVVGEKLFAYFLFKKRLIIMNGGEAFEFPEDIDELNASELYSASEDIDKLLENPEYTKINSRHSAFHRHK